MDDTQQTLFSLKSFTSLQSEAEYDFIKDNLRLPEPVASKSVKFAGQPSASESAIKIGEEVFTNPPFWIATLPPENKIEPAKSFPVELIVIEPGEVIVNIPEFDVDVSEMSASIPSTADTVQVEFQVTFFV